jgi:hypothetical protein
MPDFGIFRGFNEKLFGDKLFAGQLPINLGNNFDPDAAAFFQRVSDAGGTLSATEQLAILTLVADLKNSGIWTAMKAIYPMVGASAAACAQNLKSSSFTGTFTAGWTFASTGVKGNGTSAFFNTNFNVSSETTSSNGALGFYSRTNDTGLLACDLGAGLDPNLFQMFIRFTDNNTYFLPNTATGAIANSLNTQGFFQAIRTSATTIYGLRNTTQYTSTGTVITPPNLNAFIGARNVSGVGQLFSNRECAFAYFTNSLSVTNATDLYTAVQAFQTTLSRNV